MAYYYAINTGKGFITHEDNELEHVKQHPANIFETLNTTWAARVNATEKTLSEAQALIDAYFSGHVYPKEHPKSGQQIVYTLS